VFLFGSKVIVLVKTTITRRGLDFDATTIKDLIAVTMSLSTSTRPTELMLVAHNTTFAVKLYQILSDPEDQHVSISYFQTTCLFYQTLNLCSLDAHHKYTPYLTCTPCNRSSHGCHMVGHGRSTTESY
jgi:hypothetical protein